MIAFDFGNLCFNSGASEQNILVVISGKNMFLSMNDFITEAVNFLESDGRFCGNWTEIYKNRTNLPAIAWMKSRLEEMNQRVNILYEPIIKAVNVVPSKWNDITLGIETMNEYILYLWGTSA
ncbi:hypothetical protein [Sporofaciens musculi]|uniref:hypothetical protein n=1 Tax=Sporofaciens musculi TaxID=2681861 RepID=UPI002570709A|nr:hypothetical protein [Sporofaciens musculi]